MYKIQITKITKNPNFSKEIKDWEEKNKYNNYGNYRNGDVVQMRPEETQEENAIMCQLNEEEFEAVKKALITVWK